MKKVLVLFTVLTLAFVFTCYAQTKLEDFEAGTGTWTTDQGMTYAADITDGANATARSMYCTDDGFGGSLTRTFTGVIPSNGNYKVTFYYKNGISLSPQGNLTVTFNATGTVNVGSSLVTTWTKAETSVVGGLTAGGDITVIISGFNGVVLAQDFKIDELYLESVAAIPVVAKLRPMSAAYVAGTQTLTATATGGSGTYTQAEFDIGNDGSVESTDSTPGDGFTYAWGTIGDGAVSVKVTITDDLLGTGNATNSYTVDNTDGRQQLVQNGSFDNWTAGLPDNWQKIDIDVTGATSGGGNTTVAQETTNVYIGPNAMAITFTLTDYDYRYTMKSATFAGNLKKYQLNFAGRGGTSCRMGYASSTNGTTWTVYNTTLLGSLSGATTYNEVIETPPRVNYGTTYMTVVTHNFNAGTFYWDEVSCTASTTVSIEDWDLY